MEDRFSQQLKKGVLDMLVLELLCREPSYGYELLTRLKEETNGLFCVKEGTLYPILYRLEDDGFIEATWSAGEGRTTPKKIYAPTASGRDEQGRKRKQWHHFSKTVNDFMQKENFHET